MGVLRSGLRAGLSLSLGAFSPGASSRFEALAEIASRRLERRSSTPRWAWPLLEPYLPHPLPAGLETAELRLVGGAQELVATARTLLPVGSSRWQVRELENKLRAYLLFRKGGDLLPGEAPLDRRVAEAFTHTGYESLWLIEGIGYGHGEEVLGGRPMEHRRLLDQPLPIPALIPLHTGCGLYLARSLVTAEGHRSREGVAGYLEASSQAAWEGYRAILGEALGFAVRLLDPRRLTDVDGFLRDLKPSWRGPFWHGAGRGLYFSPGQLLPGLSRFEAALASLEAEAPDELGRTNALAGFAWAVAMVSFLTPEVPAALLELLEERSADRGWTELAPAVDGITSVSLLWYDALGTDAAYEAFYQPGHGRPHRVSEVWDRYVVAPSARALAELREAGPRGESPGGLFAYSGRGWAEPRESS